jgi:hypothetical protein
MPVVMKIKVSENKKSDFLEYALLPEYDKETCQQRWWGRMKLRERLFVPLKTLYQKARNLTQSIKRAYSNYYNDIGPLMQSLNLTEGEKYLYKTNHSARYKLFLYKFKPKKLIDYGLIAAIRVLSGIKWWILGLKNIKYKIFEYDYNNFSRADLQRIERNKLEFVDKNGVVHNREEKVCENYF